VPSPEAREFIEKEKPYLSPAGMESTEITLSGNISREKLHRYLYSKQKIKAY